MASKQQDKILEKIDTYISNGTQLKGSIYSKDLSIKIDCILEGETIEAKGIIIGQNAKIKSNIKAEIIIINGEVLGDIIATTKLEILEKAKIIGNISTSILYFSEGAFFEGNCKMLNLEKEKMGGKKYNVFNAFYEK